jgi:hypothetical protein
MTLTSTDRLPSLLSPVRWELLMRTEDARDVRVVVTDCALMAIDLPCAHGARKLEGEYRSIIEKIASANYHDGFIEQDGSVLIMRAEIG